MTETASAFLFFDCLSAKNPGEKVIEPGERIGRQYESFGVRLIAWANQALAAGVDAGHCKPFGSFQVLRRQYCSGAYYEWRSTTCCPSFLGPFSCTADVRAWREANGLMSYKDKLTEKQESAMNTFSAINVFHFSSNIMLFVSYK